MRAIGKIRIDGEVVFFLRRLVDKRDVVYLLGKRGSILIKISEVMLC